MTSLDRWPYYTVNWLDRFHCSDFNKQAELEAFLTLQNIDIFCGSESHLDSSILKFFQKIIMLIGLTEIDMEEVYSF